VEINFKSDYLPLNRMTSQSQADRIRSNSLNPDEEAKIASQERIARAQRDAQSDEQRRSSLNLRPPGADSGRPPATTPQTPQTPQRQQQSQTQQPQTPGQQPNRSQQTQFSNQQPQNPTQSQNHNQHSGAFQ